MSRGMESLPVINLVSAAHSTFPNGPSVIPFRIRRSRLQIRHFRFTVSSKQPYFQDFRKYAKPLCLWPTTEVQEYTGASLEKIPSLFRQVGSKSLYKIKIQTSGIFGSGLSDVSAGVLLCLIDENGDSILQRIQASSMEDDPSTSKDSIVSEKLHFQQGSVDEFTFEGPKLEKVGAIWISLESGQWRLGGVSLTIICGCESPAEGNDGKLSQFFGFHYDFDVEEIFLGEGSYVSMAELRPCLVTEFSGLESFALLTKNISQSASLASQGISNEESMKEYADLKFSLLLYDAILIFFGTQIASLSAGEKAAFAFLTGGIGGFLYLFLLQRSVDGIISSESNPINMGGIFGPSKRLLSSLVLALAFAILAVKYSSGDVPLALTPIEVVVGMMGFLVCKAAVVLAAFKPMLMGMKENK